MVGVDRCHKDGVIKLTVAEDPKQYIKYDPNLLPMLEGFKRSGKKVFLVTNSLWDYTHVVMNYLEGRKAGAQKDLEWTKYFDVIITGACKPSFLVDEMSLSLFRVDPTSESLQLCDNMPSDALGVETFLKKGKIFQGGNAKWLHRLLQVGSSNSLLYVGDHMYADVLRSKRTLGWRTCLVVPELTNEIISHRKSVDIRKTILSLRRKQFATQRRIDLLDDEWEVSSDEELRKMRSAKAKLVFEMKEIEKALNDKLTERDQAYHKDWGALFKAGLQESRFAKQVIDYACLYTSRASNLGNVSPERPFRPARDMSTHDIDRPLYQGS